MTKLIPENQIMKSANYGHINGDIAESFGIDISSNYGSIRASKRMKMIAKPTDMQVPLDFAYYNSKYYFCSDSFMYVGGNSPEDGFSKDTSTGAPTGIDSNNGNLEVFNGSLYVVNGSDISKLSVATWSSPAGLAGITGGVGNHLMKVFGNRLYITYDNVKVLSISTSDVVADADTVGTQFATDWNLGSGWTPTFMDVAQGSLWIGYLNTRDSRGIILQWDGDTADTYTRRIDLEAGVIAGCVLDNIPYIIDIRGRLKAYSGSGFVEIDRLNISNNQALSGVRDSGSIEKPVHPNGMIPTEDGNIMFLFKNTLEGGDKYEDTVPSGIYEYNKITGLTNRHTLSLVDMDSTSITDYGQQRLVEVEALYYRQPNSSPIENGALLAGAKYHSDGNIAEEYGLFASDEFDETQKYSYYITKKIFGTGIQDTWNKIYTVYKEFLNTTDKITIKYRVKDDIPLQAIINWTETNEFVSTDDLSAYEEGDEVQVLTANGAGKSAHIKSIEVVGSNTTVLLDDTFTGVSGSSKINLSKWKKIGDITQSNDDLQYKGLTIDGNNTSSWIQFKVCMEWTGNNEIYKQKVVNKALIKE